MSNLLHVHLALNVVIPSFAAKVRLRIIEGHLKILKIFVQQVIALQKMLAAATASFEQVKLVLLTQNHLLGLARLIAHPLEVINNRREVLVEFDLFLQELLEGLNYVLIWRLLLKLQSE